MVEHQGNCPDARSNLEHVRFHVAEILTWLGVAHLEGGPDVDAMFVVDRFEESVSQPGAKIMQVASQICLMFDTDERALLALGVHRIWVQSRRESTSQHHPSSFLQQDEHHSFHQKRDPAPHMTFHIDPFRRSIAMKLLHTSDKLLRLLVGLESQTTSCT